jgi:hypothetical protein
VSIAKNVVFATPLCLNGSRGGALSGLAGFWPMQGNTANPEERKKLHFRQNPSNILASIS